MKVSKDLKTIYLLAIASSLILILGWGVLKTPDSPTYVEAWDHISNGEIDILRTPIYPIFLGLMKLAFGTYFLTAAICVQHIVFLISIRFFYIITQELCSSFNISFWITLFYSIFPCITTWNNYILTESFAFSGTIFLIYLIIKMTHQEHKIYCTIIIAILLSMLMLLRPALVYMLPVFFIGWSYFFVKKQKMIATLGIIGTLFATVSLFSYMKVFENKYGILSSSCVGTFNQMVIAYQYNLINPDVIENGQLKEDIENKSREVSIMTLIKSYGLKDVHNVIMDSYKSHPNKVIKSCFGRLYRSKSKSLFLTLAPGFATVFDMIGFNLNTLYLFIIIYTIILLRWIYMKRSLPWTTSFIYMLGVSNIIVAIIGAQEEWERLVLPSLPLYLLMFGQLCTLFSVKSVKQLELK